MSTHNAHQTGEQLARANGFASFSDLMTASRRMRAHGGPQQFAARTPQGAELVWSEDEIGDPADGDEVIA